MSTDTTKVILSAMASALITGAGSWFAFGREAITEADLATKGPWPIERQAVLQRLGALENSHTALLAALKDLGVKLESVGDRQNALLVEQRVLASKVEDFLSRDRK
jgi:hypothetical protein